LALAFDATVHVTNRNGAPEIPVEAFFTDLFVGIHYTDDLIILDVTFIEGRLPEKRLALLKDINTVVSTVVPIVN
jgi:4-oxalocrotonate tautomerase